MLQLLRNQFVFLGQFGKRFETTGSILPSSRFLAQAITRYLAERGDEPIRVLECGPGTGAFTSHIVSHLRPDDRFDLVELNQAFVDVLENRFAAEPAWQAVAENSTVHQLPLQEFAQQEPYDFIISGLPHINFPPELVSGIFDAYCRLLKPGGTLSYFEYYCVRPIRTKVGFGESLNKVRAVNSIVEQHLQKYRIRRDTVFLNVPPAWAQHLRIE